MTNQLNQHILIAIIAVIGLVAVIAALRCLHESIQVHQWQKRHHKKLLERLHTSSLLPEEIQEVLNVQPQQFRTIWKKTRAERKARRPFVLPHLKQAHSSW